jgi:hypothetical protein
LKAKGLVVKGHRLEKLARGEGAATERQRRSEPGAVESEVVVERHKTAMTRFSPDVRGTPVSAM